MADIQRNQCLKNSSTALSTSAGAASQTIPYTKDENTILYVNNAGASPITVTVKAGNGICSVMGDLAVTVPNGTVKIIGPLETARFGDYALGKILVNLSATTSVTLAAIQV